MTKRKGHKRPIAFKRSKNSIRMLAQNVGLASPSSAPPVTPTTLSGNVDVTALTNYINAQDTALRSAITSAIANEDAAIRAYIAQQLTATPTSSGTATDIPVGSPARAYVDGQDSGIRLALESKIAAEDAKLAQAILDGDAKVVTDLEAQIAAVVAGLVHGISVDEILDAPPSRTPNGAVYLVGVAPTGAFANHANEIAHRNDGKWEFYVPEIGESHLVEKDGTTWTWNGTDWVKVAVSPSTPTAAPADIAADVHSAVVKPVPVDADELALIDSEDTFKLKRLSWVALKNALEAWYNDAPETLTHKTISGADNTLTNIPQSAVENLVKDLQKINLNVAKVEKSINGRIADANNSVDVLRAEMQLKDSTIDNDITILGDDMQSKIDDIDSRLTDVEIVASGNKADLDDLQNRFDKAEKNAVESIKKATNVETTVAANSVFISENATRIADAVVDIQENADNLTIVTDRVDTIETDIQNLHLKNLVDTEINTPNDGDLLVWNAADSKWKPVAPAAPTTPAATGGFSRRVEFFDGPSYNAPANPNTDYIIVIRPNNEPDVALLHFDDAAIPGKDTSWASADWKVINGATISTSQKKFGNSSLKCGFGGTGNNSPSGVFNQSDVGRFRFDAHFTIEMWVYPDLPTPHSYQQFLFDTRPDNFPPSGNDKEYPYLTYSAQSNEIAWYAARNSKIISGAVSGTWKNTWHHIAIVRYDTLQTDEQIMNMEPSDTFTTALYIDGKLVKEVVDNIQYDCSPGRPIIGRSGNDANAAQFAGYIDEVRICKGENRYYGPDFPLPTAPFTDTNGAAIHLPTAKNHTNSYVIVNNGGADYEIKAQPRETISGFGSIYIPHKETLELISDGSNWHELTTYVQ